MLGCDAGGRLCFLDGVGGTDEAFTLAVARSFSTFPFLVTVFFFLWCLMVICHDSGGGGESEMVGRGLLLGRRQWRRVVAAARLNRFPQRRARGVCFVGVFQDS